MQVPGSGIIAPKVHIKVPPSHEMNVSWLDGMLLGLDFHNTKKTLELINNIIQMDMVLGMWDVGPYKACKTLMGLIRPVWALLGPHGCPGRQAA